MPQRLNRPCKIRNCSAPAVTGSARCEKHQREYDQSRGTATQRGYDHDWQKARSEFLKQHPYCMKCLSHGQLVQATVVDHIQPHRGDKRLFWDRSNWQALCERCHNSKTALHDGGFSG